LVASLVKRFVVNNSGLDFRGSKQEKHADLYKSYSTATTVHKFIARGGNGGHFAYDARRGLLRMRDANDQAELTRVISFVVRSRNPTLASSVRGIGVVLGRRYSTGLARVRKIK
jgi:hypothetical protein